MVRDGKNAENGTMACGKWDECEGTDQEQANDRSQDGDS